MSSITFTKCTVVLMPETARQKLTLSVVDTFNVVSIFIIRSVKSFTKCTCNPDVKLRGT